MLKHQTTKIFQPIVQHEQQHIGEVDELEILNGFRWLNWINVRFPNLVERI